MNLYGLKEFLLDLTPEIDPKRRDALAAVFKERWPRLSDTAVMWQAAGVLESVGTVGDFPHNGKADKDALKRLSAAMNAMYAAFSEMSPAARRVLITELVEATEEFEGEVWGPPGKPVALGDLMAAGCYAASRAADSLHPEERRGQTNWRAVAAVGALRRVWKAGGEGEAPKHANAESLEDGASFAAFLGKCLNAMEISVAPRVAMNAWRKWEGVHS